MPDLRSQELQDLARAVSAWRESLVNLNGNNRLLNFRPRKTSAVEFAEPSAHAIVERLKSGKPWLLCPTPDTLEVNQYDSMRPSVRAADDGELVSQLLDTELRSALRNLSRQSSQAFLDKGIWVLYLAVGILEWSDVDGTSMQSPILLIPVSLDAPAKKSASIAKAEEDPVLNPALVLKLNELGVELPVDESAVASLNVGSVLEATAVAIERQPGWRVHPRVLLSYFSFTKEAMYRDLLENEEAVLASQLVQVIGARAGQARSDLYFEPLDDEHVDRLAPAETAPLVLDADSSQRACVAAAVAGQSFVMDGPPGTGKSQTISNMIGALIHSGKSVLFVSEKAAALEVVRNRLSEAGLGNYVLELHSHKATRKEVARALGEALSTVPRPPRGMTHADRSRVQKQREELNAYADAMNLMREPLGLSLHHVLGKLLALASLPVAPASTGLATGLTMQRLIDVNDASRRLAASWRPAREGASFAWRGVTSRRGLEGVLQQGLRLLDQLSATIQPNRAVAETFGLVGPSQAGALAAVLDLLLDRPDTTPDAWLTDANPELLARTVLTVEGLVSNFRQAEDELLRTGFDPLRIPDATRLQPLSPSITDPSGSPLDVSRLDVDAAAALISQLEEVREAVIAGHASSGAIADECQLLRPACLADASALLEAVEMTSSGDRPSRAWLLGSPEAADSVASNLRSKYAGLVEAQQIAGPFFKPSILTIDVSALAARFKENRGLKKLSGSYRADKRLLTDHLQPEVESDDGLCELARAVNLFRASQEVQQAEHAAAILGPWFAESATDWAGVGRAIDVARMLQSRFGGQDLTGLADLLCVESPVAPAFAERLHQARQRLITWATLANITGLPVDLTRLPVEKAVGWLTEQIDGLRSLQSRLHAFDLPPGRALLTLAHSEHLLHLAGRLQECAAELASQEEAHEAVCGSLYRGSDTNVPELREALAWVHRIRQLVAAGPGLEPPLTPEQAKVPVVPAQIDLLEGIAQDWDRLVTELTSAFDDSRQAELHEELQDFDDARELLEALIDDIDGKEEWFSYHDAVERLAAEGLGAVVDFCRRERCRPEQLPGILEKAILQDWAEALLAGDPALRVVRAEDRDRLVDEYRELDRQLILTATSSIVESVNSRRPSTDIGESSVIRREAEKKTRHMPVRTLIEKTQHVTQAIKPVFMMSPLAVSQFLPSGIKFDVVIFDEASQVSPADAINCIYRGHALITAGDQKQLPPTSFFTAAAAAEENEEDWEEDLGDFESVLDLAKSSGGFRSLTLRWHYRSRHEDLIAFSNANFYEGKLVTFPGAQESGPDVGVEHFPVAGVYRRGSSRDNPIEAAEVAKRVLIHFSTRPHMTCGVVTFSEAQAATVDFAIEEALRERPDLARFFSEDRLNGFFVKSLESVQGDERDVMIFSLGYGPDENGKLTHNFGPVNRNGGWRRLNVAVTRAKYRNEVISSFSAADLDPDNANDGVRRLRAYLDFAARGPAALSLDLSHSLGDAESPFEEQVLAAVRSWGYDVVPQVGAGGYRIDMAVRHREQTGAYILGIECDGYRYHSSRTARDRDRLREQVLNGLGWRLHRIWGTAWYRNRATEETRLKAAIEKAMFAPVSGLLAAAGPELVRPEVHIDDFVAPESPAWTVEYARAVVRPLPGWADVSSASSCLDMLAGIQEVAKVEGPVHVSVLTERLREAWGIGRVGRRIRETFDTAIAMAEVERTGDWIRVPGLDVSVRTPGDYPARRIETVHDEELAAAVIGLVQDSNGVDREQLLQAAARLFGWGRRGQDIEARLATTVQRLLSGRRLTQVGESLRPA